MPNKKQKQHENDTASNTRADLQVTTSPALLNLAHLPLDQVPPEHIEEWLTMRAENLTYIHAALRNGQEITNAADIIPLLTTSPDLNAILDSHSITIDKANPSQFRFTVIGKENAQALLQVDIPEIAWITTLSELVSGPDTAA